MGAVGTVLAAKTTDVPAQGAAVPGDATTFTFPHGATWVLLFSLLTAFAQAVVLFVDAWTTQDPTTRMTQIPQGVFLALVAELNWRFFLGSRHRVAVNATGIWSIRRKSTSYLAWRDVARVSADDAMQRLELTGVNGAMAVRIEYQLKDFELLRNFVLSHTAESTQVRTGAVNVFRRSWDRKFIYAAIGGLSFFVAWFVYRQFTGEVFLLPVVVTAAALVAFFLDPVSVAIAPSGVLIGYPVYERTIPFASVKGISLSDVRYRGNVWAGVLVARRRGRRIRLTRFRGGSVALYEALQTAWQRWGGPEQTAKESERPSIQDAGESTIGRKVDSPGASAKTARTIGLALAIAIIAVVGIFAWFSREVFGLSGGARVSRNHLPIYRMHEGPVAQLNELNGKGRIYLVQLGEHKDPYSVEEFAQWLRAKYALDAQVLPAMAIDSSAWNAGRHQFVAEQLEAQLKQKHLDLARDENAYLIGFTDGDMYSTEEMWDSTFTQRDRMRAAIISSDGMGDSESQKADLGAAGADDRFQARLRRILLKDVAVLYWHLPVNDDPTSLLHDTLDPDLPTEDIYESDVNGARTQRGEHVDEPCVFFTYSSKDGLQRAPGPVIRRCGDFQDPMEDESKEVFELDLRLGLLIDKHTDMYLPDTIPIEFQRVTRDGELGRDPFGVSGWDNYDEFLGSADNIQIFIEHADGAKDELRRVPEWMPIQGLAKFVGGESGWAYPTGLMDSTPRQVWQYQMAWHQFPFEHYDVLRFNGGMKTYLPCDSPEVNCSLIGYRDSQGRELKIERDSRRHLSRIISPNGRWVGVATAPDGRILALDDSDGRTVVYTYDADNRLTGVSYPSGENYQYEYDGSRHLVAISVSGDSHSEPQIILRNEYENGMLSKQTLGNGGVYTYTYDSSSAATIHHANVKTPEGKAYSVDISESLSVVHELPAEQGAPSGRW
jgi:YD repeat-containing protein